MVVWVEDGTRHHITLSQDLIQSKAHQTLFHPIKTGRDEVASEENFTSISCFYNIRVNETSAENDKQRTCYEFSCEENTINLTVKNVTYTATLTHANIEFLFSKEYSSVNKGNITIYLNEELFDLKKPITILLNGKKIFKGKVKPSLDTMVESCALYYDPERIFPAAIEVDIANQKAKDVTKK